MINFKEVTKKFGRVTALEKVSFEIDPGEIVFLTGPSGSGKTTLIRLIIGEFKPTEGEIKVNGMDLATIKPKNLYQLRRQVGVVFQDFKLLFDRTVRENVAFALEITSGKDKDFGEKINKVLSLVGLEDRADFFPSQLAGGELQRACIARAVVGEPEIIIADEPTGNLDITTAWQIINLLQEINRSGKTVLVSTHNFEIVDSLGCRVLELNKGKLVRDEAKGKYKIG